ncbi:MAG TPA: hypothetical protein VE961_16880 [Pyrinomonadaceae bacterium]|nr:hypothetical protein [Pyrinomonadaceae bacterium]
MAGDGRNRDGGLYGRFAEEIQTELGASGFSCSVMRFGLLGAYLITLMP